jgi:large subunit ribosomal protein L23
VTTRRPEPTRIDSRDLPDVLHKPIITEKATRQMEQNKFVFDVAPKSTKIDIKAAVENMFNIKVVRVDTYNPPRRKKRVGRFAGYKPHFKRAIVTVAEGQTIPIFPEA